MSRFEIAYTDILEMPIKLIEKLFEMKIKDNKKSSGDKGVEVNKHPYFDLIRQSYDK